MSFQEKLVSRTKRVFFGHIPNKSSTWPRPVYDVHRNATIVTDLDWGDAELTDERMFVVSRGGQVVSKHRGYRMDLPRLGRLYMSRYMSRINGTSVTPPRRLRGEYYLWSSIDWAYVNYEHFLTQHAPKLLHFLALRAAYTSTKLLVHADDARSSIVREILRALSMTEPSSRHILDVNARYHVDSVVLSSTPNVDAINEASIRLFRALQTFALRGSAPPVNQPVLAGTFRPAVSGRRIYLRRDDARAGADPDRKNNRVGGSRNALNEAELLTAMLDRGFEVIQLGHLSLAAKAAALANARVIVTPVGANVLNLMFLKSSPHAVVLLDPCGLGFNGARFVGCAGPFIWGAPAGTPMHAAAKHSTSARGSSRMYTAHHVEWLYLQSAGRQMEFAQTCSHSISLDEFRVALDYALRVGNVVAAVQSPGELGLTAIGNANTTSNQPTSQQTNASIARHLQRISLPCVAAVQCQSGGC